MKHLTFLDYTVLEAMGASTEDLQVKAKEIRVLQNRIAKLEQSQLKTMELLNDPAMVIHIRTDPQHFIAAAKAADEDTADTVNYIKEISRSVRKQATKVKRP